MGEVLLHASSELETVHPWTNLELIYDESGARLCMGQGLLEPHDTRIGVFKCLKHRNAESDILAAHIVR